MVQAKIKALLLLVDQGELGCSEAKDITERHLCDIRGKVARGLWL